MTEAAGGICHQLSLVTLERDGVLPPGGWHICNGIQFIGPMGRAGHPIGSA